MPVVKVACLLFRENGECKDYEDEDECQVVVLHLQHLVGKYTPAFQHKSSEDEQTQLAQLQEIEDET